MDLEVFDLAEAVLEGKRDPSFCERIVSCLRETSCLVVRDPRVSIEDNERFLNMMESYFMQPAEVKSHQARPDLHYQVGLTPEGMEIPEALHDPSQAEALQRDLLPENRPRIPKGPDPKCRYMWRIGSGKDRTAFQEYDTGSIVPEGFTDWHQVLNTWGEKLLATVATVTELISVGLGLDDVLALTRVLHEGPHLLAPTGVDVSLHPEIDTCIAGYHTDLNLITAHGKARYPGLYIWLRNGKRIAVRLAEGCLLLQAGMQLEYLTGGYIKAGLHEVVISRETLEALERAKLSGKSTWRVSSTFFCHAEPNVTLHPLGKYNTEESRQEYPSIAAGEFVARILKRINLF